MSPCMPMHMSIHMSLRTRWTLPISSQLGRTYIGHSYIGHNHIGHNHIGHNYIDHNYIDHNYIGGRCP